MKGYGLYVWAAFSFTLISFATLYTLIKINLVKEKIKVEQIQSTHREILANRISSKI
jgi:heme exporter protein D